MNIKKGDILYSEVYKDLCISMIDKYNEKADKIPNEDIFISDRNLSREEIAQNYAWKKRALGIYNTYLAGSGVKYYKILGNYFSLENPEKLMKGLMSPDLAVRNFYLEILKSKCK